MAIDRRQFLRYLMALGAGLAGGQLPANQAPAGDQHRRAIPSTGELLPVIGLGSWITFGIDPSNAPDMRRRQAILAEFLAAGGGMLDSSPMYGNAQQVIGECLQAIGHHRGLFSATKVWTLGDREGVLEMENSRLLWGLPHLDLMQVHNLLDWQTHLPTLHEMKARGEIRYVGVTTSHGRRHAELRRIMASQKLDFVQFTYNVLDREVEDYLLPMAADKGIAVIINRPFQRGGLFDHVGNRPLPAWAADIDCQNWAQFFLKFIVSHPAVTCAIPATSRLDHLKENMAAAYGSLPDAGFRRRMANYVRAI